jgi:3-hydroxyisobutyrate dehydrogenase
MKLAFIGLGVMGGPMAGHLAKAGHSVTVYNRSRDKVQAWAAQHSGTVADTPAAAAAAADIVFSCVGNDDDVREVTIGQHGAFQGMKRDAIFVDHTTASAAVAQELHAVASGAEQGILTVMVGGDAGPYARAEPAIAHYARAVTLMGPAGAGQKTKMVNQICVAGVVQGLAEGLAFAMYAGLDAKRVVDVISKGAATSWQMENRGKTMIDGKFDFGFAVNLMRKDLRIAMEEARGNGAQLPSIALIDQFYAKVQQQGGGKLDTSSLIKLLVKQ